MANEPTPASAATDEPIYDVGPDSFEILWAKYKVAIIAGALAIVVGLLAIFGWMAYSHSARIAAEEQLAGATSAEELRAVIDDHGASVVAGNAAMLLAATLREEEKLDEANAVLQEFRDSQPDHPFAPLAGIALAENAALAGDVEKAVTDFQGVADANASSFTAAPALLFKAELELSSADRNGALRSFQKLENQYANTVAGQSAVQVFDSLRSLARVAGSSDAEASVEDAPPVEE